VIRTKWDVEGSNSFQVNDVALPAKEPAPMKVPGSQPLSLVLRSSHCWRAAESPPLQAKRGIRSLLPADPSLVPPSGRLRAREPASRLYRSGQSTW